MAINFPDSPTLGQTYSENNIAWQWDGIAWGRLASFGLDDLSNVDLTGLNDNEILVYDSATGNFLPEPQTSYTTANFDSDFGTKTTTNLAEGSNLYYTDERVDDRVSNLLVPGNKITLSYNDGAGTLTISSTFDSADVAALLVPIQAQIDSDGTAIQTLKNTVVSLQNQINSDGGDIAQLFTTTTSLQNQINSDGADIQSLFTTTTSLQNQIDSDGTAIQTLKNRVDGHDSDIAVLQSAGGSIVRYARFAQNRFVSSAENSSTLCYWIEKDSDTIASAVGTNKEFIQVSENGTYALDVSIPTAPFGTDAFRIEIEMQHQDSVGSVVKTYQEAYSFPATTGFSGAQCNWRAKTQAYMNANDRWRVTFTHTDEDIVGGTSTISIYDDELGSVELSGLGQNTFITKLGEKP